MAMRKHIVILFAAIALITFSNLPLLFADEEKLTSEDAEKVLSSVIPDIKVIEVRPSQIKGLWEIALESKGQKGILYLDSSKNYILSGSILDIKTKSNLTQERFAQINKVDVSQIPLDDALVMGAPDAKYRVIVFDDPE
jgi:thiol:disulfide interchange protein DsbC